MRVHTSVSVFTRDGEVVTGSLPLTLPSQTHSEIFSLSFGFSFGFQFLSLMSYLEGHGEGEVLLVTARGGAGVLREFLCPFLRPMVLFWWANNGLEVDLWNLLLFFGDTFGALAVRNGD